MSAVSMAAGPVPLAGPVSLSASPPRWRRAVILAWIGICSLLLAINRGAAFQWRFHDPDDELRLQQVRDLLAGQGWFDLHQYRIDAAAGGVLMHWSRLVDMPIAGVILLFRPLLGAEGAEMAALILVPALTLLAILMLVGWTASRVLPASALGLVLLACVFAVPALLQVLPSRIDHHGWQIVCALAAIAALLNHNHRRGGWLAGAALAAWMAISLEGLPLSAWFVAVLGGAGMVHEKSRQQLVATVQGLAVVSPALFLATRGLVDLAPHCDAIAPPHLAAFAWGALCVTVANSLAPRSPVALAAGLGVAGAGALGLILAMAPQCASGSFDMLDPVVRTFWYDAVYEGKPVTLAPAPLVLQYLLPPLVGLGAALWLAREQVGELRFWWLVYAAVLAGAIALGMMVARASAVSGALAVVPLGWLLSLRLAHLKRPRNLVLRAGELLGAGAFIFAVTLPVVPALMVSKLIGNDSDPADTSDSVTLACEARLATATLSALPRDGLLAPMDIGPHLLLHSRKSVLSTGHHRGAKAMRATIDAFSGTATDARRIMTDRKLSYVVICPDLSEQGRYVARSPNGFAAQLARGQVPLWLRPVPMPAASGLRMWERADKP